MTILTRKSFNKLDIYFLHILNNRCEKLVSQNNLLRGQLEESHQLNEALTNDLQKLTNDWEALRDEMTIKEDEWKDEEQVCFLRSLK